jgi:hypothetical protein
MMIEEKEAKRKTAGQFQKIRKKRLPESESTARRPQRTYQKVQADRNA